MPASNFPARYLYDYDWTGDPMIGFLKGRVLPGGSILTAGGVGYEVRHCGAQAHSPGDEVELLVTTLTCSAP